MDNLFEIIQIAVTPVFLLAGIGGLLNVMSGRLARVIDRARRVERALARIEEDEKKPAAKLELKILWRRISLSNWSIALCTFSGLLVCVLVVSLFSATLAPSSMEAAVAILFIASILFLIASLATFLMEIRLAIKSLREGHEYIILSE